jgi:hypothetical protein
VYNILCDSVGMEPMPNNGTLRLPLKPAGLHDSETTLAEPTDPVPATSSSAEPSSVDLEPSSPVVEVSPIEASSAADVNEGPPKVVGVDPVMADPKEQQPSGDNGGEDGDDTPESVADFWDWLTGKVDDFWSSLTGSKDDSKEDSESD